MRTPLLSALHSFVPKKLLFPLSFPFSKRNLQQKINKQRKESTQSANQNKPSDPQFALQTPAQKWGIKVSLQIPTLLAPSILLISYLNNPFCDPYFYLLFGAEKIAFALTLLNIRYPQNSRNFNYGTIVAALAANTLIPITNVQSIGLQFFQILILLSEEAKKMDEDLKLNEQQKLTLKLRLHIKIFLFFSATSIIIFKLNYHYHRFLMDKKIAQYNKLNQLDKQIPNEEKEVEKGKK